jgi:hypothetical protein
VTIQEMQARFEAYDVESLRFTFGEWLTLSCAERDSKQAEIDAKHSYRHGWICVDGQSFDRHTAFPDQVFLNVWD